MLISFTVENFRSIKECITLDLQAVGQVSELKENVIETPKLNLLKSAVIYGANGSGKSNIIKAIAFFTNFIHNSIRQQEGEPISDVVPFLLSDDSQRNKPSFFEVELFIDSDKYRYGFEVSSEKVHAEWLYLLPNKKRKERELFLREDEEIEVFSKNFDEGLGLEEKTRNNALFLSVCAQFNGIISKSLIHFFKRIGVISGIEDRHLRNFTSDFIKKKNNYETIIKSLQQADFGIEKIYEEKPFESELPKNLPEDFPDEFKDQLKSVTALFTERKRFNSTGQECGYARLSFDDAESAGTQKYFHLLGPIQDTLKSGEIIIVDELDARLHPKLTLNIVRMFHDPIINCKGAQLIFATHDTNLLSSGEFRRDQILFTEKNRSSSSDLYSLAEFKLDNETKVRKDARFKKDYLKGRYGAIPFMGSLEFLKKLHQQNGDV